MKNVEKHILERGYVTPNDACAISDTDSHSINNAVALAIATGLGKVVIPRYNARSGKMQWDTDEAIILSSNLEIVLDNCYIRQTDGSMDNVFRNFDDERVRTTLEEEQHNIVIRGVGNAVLDGGNHNGLTQKTSLKDGLPHVEKNNLIRLHNLSGFRIENLTLANQRWWAMNLLYCECGVISDITINCKNDVHNQDGIDLRHGCNNILVERIFGAAGDDVVAMTGFFNNRSSDKYAVEGKSKDIHDIIVRNVIATSAECTVVGMRCQDGVKLYNITVDSIYDSMSSATAAIKAPSYIFNFDNNSYKTPKSPYSVIRIGQDGYVNKIPCAPGDVHSIHVTNIHARTNAAVLINVDIENSYFGNIYAENDVDRVITTRSCRDHQCYGANMRNTVFENIFYSCTDNEDSVVFDFDINQRDFALDGVTIRNAYVGEASTVINMQHLGRLTATDIYGNDVEKKITVRDGSTVILDGKKI